LRVRNERYGMDLRQRMRLVSLLFLLGYPFFLALFVPSTRTNAYGNAALWAIYWFFALPVGIALLVTSFVMGRRK